MSSAEFSPAENNVIRGLHTDIVLDNDANELQDYFDSSYGPQTLYTMPPDGLHFPVRYASLEFHKNDADDMSLFANTSFDAIVINSQNIKNWQKFMNGRISEILSMNGYEQYRLPHQLHDSYIKLDDTTAAHLQFGTGTQECSIVLSTESLSNLSYASEGKHRFEPDPDDAELPNHVELLQKFAGVWSLVLDTITEELGQVELEERERPRIIVSAPATPSRELVVPQADETPTHDAYDDFPEIEKTTSDDFGFNLIGGLTDAKERLMTIAEMFRDPVGAYMYGVSAQHFLLHGPPGTGKTSLVKAFANELGASLEVIKSTNIISKWVGESGQNIEEVFERVKARPGNELIVVFFDEFETLAAAGRLGTQERVDVKKFLNQAIDDISKNHKNILLAAATNADIDSLEASLVRPERFEPIAAGVPNEVERIDVWAAVLARSIASFGGVDDIEQYSSDVAIRDVFVPYSDDINPVELAEYTDGMTGAHFEAILTRARLRKFKEYQKTHELNVVTHADLLHEITAYGR